MMASAAALATAFGDDFFWVEYTHSDVEEYARGFLDLQFGYPRRDYVLYVVQTKIDKARAPEGKQVLHIYAFAPYDLKDGGAKRWDEIGQEVADGFLEDIRSITTNMGDENILGRSFMTPLDIERHNPAMIKGDFLHFAMYNWQIGGNRPLPGWSSYRMRAS